MIPSRFSEQLMRLSAKDQIDLLLDRRLPDVSGSLVTFVFRGLADQVELRHWIFGLRSSMPMQRVGQSDVWFCVMEFPEKSRIEYKFGVVRDGHERWILDPANPLVAHDPFGGNSVVHCKGYFEPEWAQSNPEASQGTIHQISIDSRVFQETRTSRVYLPANYRDYRRHRLVIAHDGEDYLKYSRLATVVDNLVDRLEIPPLVIALLNPGDRLLEYAGDRRHAKYIVKELIPSLEKRFSLIREASGRCLMGASFGGVASLSTAWQYPGTFDSLLLQSGSFAFTDIGHHWRDQVFDPVVEFMNAFRHRPGKFAKRVFVSCGVYESLIYENRSLVPFLQNHGIETKFVEARDGHNWENWRDRLRDGLTWLYPGPLWQTYM